MEKLHLVAMSYERDALLNALKRTGAVEIKTKEETEDTAPLETDCEGAAARAERAERALAILSERTDSYLKDHKIKSDLLKDGFAVTCSDFLSVKDRAGQAEALIDQILALAEAAREREGELAKLRRSLCAAEIYRELDTPLAQFAHTAHVRVKLGTIPKENLPSFEAEVRQSLLTEFRILNTAEEFALVLCCWHESVAETEEILQNAAFAPCAESTSQTGREAYRSLGKRTRNAQERLRETEKELLALGTEIRQLKLYCDFLGFEAEKAALSEKMRATETTFLLEAYVPKRAEAQVAAAIGGVTGAAWYAFAPCEEDEVPPTLYENNAVVKNFESITDMYSPANAREFDPNTIMAFFYSVFLGFIMADIGYGLFMLLGGGLIWWKKRKEDGTFKRLAGVFAIGGIFALIWGFLFNSFFGIAMPWIPTVMPNAQKDMWSFLGIKIPAVLVISLEIGVVQLFAGYLCRAVQCMRRGKFWDGMLDGFVWAAFSLGVGLAIAGLTQEAGLPVLATVGGITAGVSLAIAMLTAGRKEKLLGKFTKGFGAAYGVINYASDVLSYARLYGLMLSGAVIAQIISGYAVSGMNGGVGFLMSGNIGLIILGVVLLIVGHAFNLAIGLLGAYIHDARLQYVEFYGRFFEGEGELFKPLGASQKYVRVENEKLPQA